MPEIIGVNVITEQRFLAHQGEIFAEAVSGKAFWLRYLVSFSWVNVVARVQQVDSLPKIAVPMIDDRIRVVPLPNYYGPAQLLSHFTQLWSRTRQIAGDDSAYILRVPGMLGTLFYRHLRGRGWPYAVEVVGDPNGSLSVQAIGKSWARFIRPLAVQEMRKQCRDAAAASYVTARTLQKEYPSQAGFVTHYSSIELPDALINLPSGQENRNTKEMPQLIFVGSLSQRYKGLHILLQALEICKEKNMGFHLHVLGDGSHRQEYEQLASQLGLDEAVSFHGYVKQGAEVFNCLRQSDLFIMPSIIEGLPRAMIEAMACGLPCIGSSIGGIPELIEAEDLVPPGDVQALSESILKMVNDPQRMKITGTRNRQVALQYRSQVLKPRRREMYDYLREITLQHRNPQRKESMAGFG